MNYEDRREFDEYGPDPTDADYVPQTERSMFKVTHALFTPGRIVFGPSMNTLLAESPDDTMRAVQAHLNGDWGCIASDMASLNDRHVMDGIGQIESIQQVDAAQKWHVKHLVHVITYASRSMTTVELYGQEENFK